MQVERKGKAKVNVVSLKDKDVLLKSWRIVPYSAIEKELSSVGKTFVEGINRKTAWAASKKLTKRLGYTVIARTALLPLDNNTYMEGYAFLKEGDEL